jgi:hypothetical protein
MSTQPRSILHCPECGQRTAWLMVEGERSRLFDCKCGWSGEIDRPACEPVVEFQTRAKIQTRLFPLGGHPS